MSRVIYLPEMRDAFNSEVLNNPGVHPSFVDRFQSPVYEKFGNARVLLRAGPDSGLSSSEVAVAVCTKGARGFPGYSLVNDGPFHWPAGEGMTVKDQDSGNTYVDFSASEIPEYTHTGYTLLTFFGNKYESILYKGFAGINPVRDAPSLNSVAIVNFYGESVGFEVEEAGSYEATISNGGVYWWDYTPNYDYHIGFFIGDPSLSNPVDDTPVSGPSWLMSGLRIMILYPPKFDTSLTAQLHQYPCPLNRAYNA